MKRENNYDDISASGTTPPITTTLATTAFAVIVPTVIVTPDGTAQDGTDQLGRCTQLHRSVPPLDGIAVEHFDVAPFVAMFALKATAAPSTPSTTRRLFRSLLR